MGCAEEEKPVAPLTATDMAEETAEGYLRSTPGLSKRALRKQLLWEGYDRLDVIIAMDILDVDYTEQAKIQAESYTSWKDFTYQGLVDQLMFEGFTKKQAIAGAEHVL